MALSCLSLENIFVCLFVKIFFLTTCLVLGHSAGRLTHVETQPPQIVVPTFTVSRDDWDKFGHIYDLFPASLTNPTGCPVGATVFVSVGAAEGISPSSIPNRDDIELGVYGDAHIASGTLTSRADIQNITSIVTRKLNVTKMFGWRLESSLSAISPNIFSYLADEGFLYDSSVSVGNTGPVHLETSWDFPCMSNQTCSTGKLLPNFWEVPYWPLTANESTCPQIGKCSVEFTASKSMLQTMMDNFQVVSQGKRMPFVLNIDASWLTKDTHRTELINFLTWVSNEQGAYITNAKSVVAWLRSPNQTDIFTKHCPSGINARVPKPTAISDKPEVQIRSPLHFGIPDLFSRRNKYIYYFATTQKPNDMSSGVSHVKWKPCRIIIFFLLSIFSSLRLFV